MVEVVDGRDRRVVWQSPLCEIVYENCLRVGSDGQYGGPSLSVSGWAGISLDNQMVPKEVLRFNLFGASGLTDHFYVDPSPVPSRNRSMLFYSDPEKVPFEGLMELLERPALLCRQVAQAGHPDLARHLFLQSSALVQLALKIRLIHQGAKG